VAHFLKARIILAIPQFSTVHKILLGSS